MPGGAPEPLLPSVGQPSAQQRSRLLPPPLVTSAAAGRAAPDSSSSSGGGGGGGQSAEEDVVAEVLRRLGPGVRLRRSALESTVQALVGCTHPPQHSQLTTAERAEVVLNHLLGAAAPNPTPPSSARRSSSRQRPQRRTHQQDTTRVEADVQLLRDEVQALRHEQQVGRKLHAGALSLMKDEIMQALGMSRIEQPAADGSGGKWQQSLSEARAVQLEQQLSLQLAQLRDYQAKQAQLRKQGAQLETALQKSFKSTAIAQVDKMEDVHTSDQVGRDLTNHMETILAGRGHSLATGAEREVLQDVQEKLIYIASEVEAALRTATKTYDESSDQAGRGLVEYMEKILASRGHTLPSHAAHNIVRGAHEKLAFVAREAEAKLHALKTQMKNTAAEIATAAAKQSSPLTVAAAAAAHAELRAELRSLRHEQLLQRARVYPTVAAKLDGSKIAGVDATALDVEVKRWEQAEWEQGHDAHLRIIALICKAHTDFDESDRQFRELSSAHWGLVDDGARFTPAEFNSNIGTLKAGIARDEYIAFHYTDGRSVGFILAPQSMGLRASQVGQLGGGLSVCLRKPTDMSWAQWGRGEFRPTTGKELWGSKAADILLGAQRADGENGKDWQKVNYVFIVKVKKAVLQRMDRRVVGRDCVSIIDKSDLLEHEGNHYLPKSAIVKVYRLHNPNAALQADLDKQQVEIDFKTALENFPYRDRFERTTATLDLSDATLSEPELRTLAVVLPMCALRQLKLARYTLDAADESVELAECGLGATDARILAGWLPRKEVAATRVDLRGNNIGRTIIVKGGARTDAELSSFIPEGEAYGSWSKSGGGPCVELDGRWGEVSFLASGSSFILKWVDDGSDSGWLKDVDAARLGRTVASRDELIDGYSHVEQLGLALSTAPRLRTADLSHCHLDAQAAVKLVAKGKWSRAGLTHLSLAHNPIKDDGIAAALEALRHVSLVHLDISHAEIGPPSTVKLATILRDATPLGAALASLTMSGNVPAGRISKDNDGNAPWLPGKELEAWTALCDVVQDSQMTEWNISDCYLGPDAMTILATRLSATRLKEVTMSGNPLTGGEVWPRGVKGGEDISGVSVLFPAMTNFVTLNVSNCGLGPTAMLELSKLVRDASAVINLVNVIGNAIGEPGAQTLIEVFDANPKLHSLLGIEPGSTSADLSNKNMQPHDCIILAHEMKASRAAAVVTSLTVDSNDLFGTKEWMPDYKHAHLDMTGWTALCMALKSSNSLVSFSAADVDMNPEAVAMLSDAIKAMAAALASVNLSDNRAIDQESRSALQESVSSRQPTIELVWDKQVSRNGM